MLVVNDIFLSIDGEVSSLGQCRLTMFIRLQGCNLTCSYCDTPETWKEDRGHDMTSEDILSVWKDLGSPHKITITGGEPLMQGEMLYKLIDIFLEIIEPEVSITIETNGTYDVPYVYKSGLRRRVSWVVDYKLGMGDIGIKHKLLVYLKSNSWVKFVIDNIKQLEDVGDIKDKLKSEGCEARFAVSAVHGSITPKTLINALIERRLWDVTANFQLHKLLGVK